MGFTTLVKNIRMPSGHLWPWDVPELMISAISITRALLRVPGPSNFGVSKFASERNPPNHFKRPKEFDQIKVI